MAKQTDTQKIALTGMLGALALALAWLESLLPAFPFLPPGAKPGLSNIVTMFAVSTLGVPYGIFTMAVKALFAFITRGATAGLMSLCGGLVSLIAMCVIFRTPLKEKLGAIGIGVICALSHNLGQLAAATILTSTATILGYAPALLVFGVFTGIATGCIFGAVNPLLIKQSKFFVKIKTSNKQEMKK